MTKHVFHCIDGHTGGMPVRLVIDGAPHLEGKTQSERRQHFLNEYDWIRKALMFEPRGHDAMSGALLYPPSSDEFDMGLIYIETSGALPMCGHGTIGSVTFALENGCVKPGLPGRVRVETPAGLVTAEYTQKNDRISSVKLTNVPSFLLVRDLRIDLPPLGSLTFDVAYGGNFYPIIEPQDNFTGVSDYTISDLRGMGWEVQCRINDSIDIVHPQDKSIRGVKHCMWTGEPLHQGSNGRSVVVAGKSLIDRSPCGTGTSARVAQRVARGLLNVGEPFVHESVIGSQFIGCAAQAAKIDGYDAVIPTIEGTAWITGENTIFVDDAEPFPQGFRI
ncbi:MAG: 4-hydroxyproline epimerase [Arenicellales bacterium]|nr:4-hydroxyproline epimerase [Arenicellales bacterium]